MRSDKRIRALHVLGSAGQDGAGIARLVGGLARSLDAGRYGIAACFLGPSGPMAEELARTGTPVELVSWRRGAKDPAGALAFWNSLRRDSPDIVHLHFGGRSVLWVARRAGGSARLVYHIHSTPAPSIPLGRADAVLAVSRAAAQGVRGETVRIVYPGVSLAEWNPAPAPPDDPIIFGFAGRLVPAKGVDSLLRATADVAKRHPRVRLDIAGMGPLEGDLRAGAAALGIEGRVRFLGWRENLKEVMAGWHALVHPSLEESFGLAIIEAMAAGLPVIATEIGGIPEIVVEGATGWLVPAGDGDALAGRMSELIVHPSLRMSMGAAGRQRCIEKFTIERMAREIEALYGDLLLGGAR